MKVEIIVNDYPKMILELYPEIAPITVNNFLSLVEKKFYEGLIFHRVIAKFMIQGGGYDTNNQHKEAQSIKGEFNSNGVANSLKHQRGVISMARTMVKDSASSQFFIMHQDSPHLDGEYAGFGKLVEGFETLDIIATAKTGPSDKPIVPQVIKSIKVL